MSFNFFFAKMTKLPLVKKFPEFCHFSEIFVPGNFINFLLKNVGYCNYDDSLGEY